MIARERDFEARAVLPADTVLGRCFGCDTDITRGMCREYLAIKVGDSFMCNVCEGGGPDQ